jgi:Type II CAAX prenyl endopeptidase Rce1-like
VYQSIADFACIGILVFLTRREGIRLLDIVGYNKRLLPRDLLLSIAFFLIMFLANAGGAAFSSLVLYGVFPPAIPDAFSRHLPMWGVIYSRCFYWIPQAFAEELTYQGYALPRMQGLMKKTWPAIACVTLGWSLQHCFIGFAFDIRQLLYMFLSFIPCLIIFQLLYLHIRRLPSFILAHWAGDFLVTVWTLH